MNTKSNTSHQPQPSPTGGNGGASLIDGKATAALIKKEIKQDVERIVAEGG